MMQFMNNAYKGCRIQLLHYIVLLRNWCSPVQVLQEYLFILLNAHIHIVLQHLRTGNHSDICVEATAEKLET